MRLRQPLIAGLFAGIVIFVAACGDDSGSSSSDSTTDQATDEPSDTSIDVWTATMCTSLGDWLDTITTISSDAGDVVNLQGTVDDNNTGNSGDGGDLSIEEARAQLVDLFGQATDASDELVQSLEDAGAPDIDQGQELQDLFVENFGAARDAFAQARDDAENLPTDDQQQFQDDAQQIVDDLDVAGTDIQTAFSDADEQLDTTEFDEAFRNDDSCTALALGTNDTDNTGSDNTGDNSGRHSGDVGA